MLIFRMRLLLATLWVGSTWTVGYVVAPTLFASLADRVLAGTIAGTLFRIEAWISLICGVSLLGVFRISSEQCADLRLLVLTTAMLLCTLIGYFGLQPFMAALRETAGPNGVLESEARIHFGILHGAASGFYLLRSLLGAMLILRLQSRLA
jgi:uncharacterized protein DUF4149